MSKPEDLTIFVRIIPTASAAVTEGHHIALVSAAAPIIVGNPTGLYLTHKGNTFFSARRAQSRPEAGIVDGTSESEDTVLSAHVRLVGDKTSHKDQLLNKLLYTATSHAVELALNGCLLGDISLGCDGKTASPLGVLDVCASGAIRTGKARSIMEAISIHGTNAGHLDGAALDPLGRESGVYNFASIAREIHAGNKVAGLFNGQSTGFSMRYPLTSAPAITDLPSPGPPGRISDKPRDYDILAPLSRSVVPLYPFFAGEDLLVVDAPHLATLLRPLLLRSIHYHAQCDGARLRLSAAGALHWLAQLHRILASGSMATPLLAQMIMAALVDVPLLFDNILLPRQHHMLRGDEDLAAYCGSFAQRDKTDKHYQAGALEAEALISGHLMTLMGQLLKGLILRAHWAARLDPNTYSIECLACQLPPATAPAMRDGFDNIQPTTVASIVNDPTFLPPTFFLADDPFAIHGPTPEELASRVIYIRETSTDSVAAAPKGKKYQVGVVPDTQVHHVVNTFHTYYYPVPPNMGLLLLEGMPLGRFSAPTLAATQITGLPDGGPGRGAGLGHLAGELTLSPALYHCQTFNNAGRIRIKDYMLFLDNVNNSIETQKGGRPRITDAFLSLPLFYEPERDQDDIGGSALHSVDTAESPNELLQRRFHCAQVWVWERDRIMFSDIDQDAIMSAASALAKVSHGGNTSIHPFAVGKELEEMKRRLLSHIMLFVGEHCLVQRTGGIDVLGDYMRATFGCSNNSGNGISNSAARTVRMRYKAVRLGTSVRGGKEDIVTGGGSSTSNATLATLMAAFEQGGLLQGEGDRTATVLPATNCNASKKSNANTKGDVLPVFLMVRDVTHGNMMAMLLIPRAAAKKGRGCSVVWRPGDPYQGNAHQDFSDPNALSSGRLGDGATASLRAILALAEELLIGTAAGQRRRGPGLSTASPSVPRGHPAGGLLPQLRATSGLCAVQLRLLSAGAAPVLLRTYAPALPPILVLGSSGRPSFAPVESAEPAAIDLLANVQLRLNEFTLQWLASVAAIHNTFDDYDDPSPLATAAIGQYHHSIFEALVLLPQSLPFNNNSNSSNSNHQKHCQSYIGGAMLRYRQMMVHVEAVTLPGGRVRLPDRTISMSMDSSSLVVSLMIEAQPINMSSHGGHHTSGNVYAGGARFHSIDHIRQLAHALAAKLS